MHTCIHAYIHKHLDQSIHELMLRKPCNLLLCEWLHILIIPMNEIVRRTHTNSIRSCVCVCVCVNKVIRCMHTNYIHAHTCMYTCTHTYTTNQTSNFDVHKMIMCMHAYIIIWLYMYVYVHVCICVHIQTHIYVCVCFCVCVCVYIYIYIYIYIYLSYVRWCAEPRFSCQSRNMSWCVFLKYVCGCVSGKYVCGCVDGCVWMSRMHMIV
jgi:hypothetical protein